MGTLSSSISSLASSTFLDLFKTTKKGKSLDSRQEIWWSRAFTFIWGIVLIGGAMIFTDTKNPVVELGLKIASFTYGGLLGTFFLGLFSKRLRQTDAAFGFIAGIAAMVMILQYTKIDFTWHTFFGCSVTLLAGNLSRILREHFFATSQK